MSRLLLLSVLCLFGLCAGCNKDDDSEKGFRCANGNCDEVNEDPQFFTLADCENNCGSGANTSGYDCKEGKCVESAIDAQYKTLQECKDACDDPGTVTFTVTWEDTYKGCSPAYAVTIGLGYTLEEVQDGNFLAIGGGKDFSPTTYTKKKLGAATYYYRATKSYNDEQCGKDDNAPDEVIKFGSFEVESGKTTTVNLVL